VDLGAAPGRQLLSAHTTRPIAVIAPAPGQFTDVAGDPTRADVLAQAPAPPAFPRANSETHLTDRKVGPSGALPRL
jgi:hypothetical protein